MKFVIDQQLTPKLCTWLKKRGFASWHIREFEMRRANDTAIWHKVKQLGAVLITKDRDFVILNDRDQTEQIILVTIGNCENEVLFAAFDAQWDVAIHRLQRGEGLIEIR